jgi:3-oxoacyl-[acyl-carrier protein] reductase
LIVGAASSFGGGLVKKFKAAGDRIIATHNRTFSGHDTDGIHRRPLDLQDEGSIASLAQWVKDGALKIDVAVFAAGILPGYSLADYDFGQIDRVMAVNFSGQAKLLNALLPDFNDGGQVIMISSISALGGSYDPIYAASKGAILAFVKSLARQLAPRLRVNAVAPGLIKGSSMYHEMSEETIQSHIQGTPTKQLLLPDDLASIIVDLTRPHWRQLNGECISVNGGRYVR